ncbi:MAG: CRISPR-associated endoribonuclease Cas6, partial [Thermoplasmata archaeon]|nr:CRISPR-associated endoribonuclease Cas6 [Thermoplasmata archaeon]
NRKGFKFFTYSNIFPINDFFPDKEKTLIVSSPSKKLIEAFYEGLKDKNHIYLSDTPLKIVEVKMFSIKPTGKFITATPIVVQKKPGVYISFEQGDTVELFLERIKENAIKKYNAFYDDELSLEEELFDLLKFYKEVAMILKKDDKEFTVIGSLWSLLQKRIPKGYGKFYRFILDCGLGEKNSLGFGFLNVIK